MYVVLLFPPPPPDESLAFEIVPPKMHRHLTDCFDGERSVKFSGIFHKE